MPTSADASSPLTFDLKEDLLEKIDFARSGLGLNTNSEVIRRAIDTFNFGSYRAPVVAHRQISVRLRQSTKSKLVKLARKHDVSVGELLRTAIDALPVKGARKNGAKPRK